MHIFPNGKKYIGMTCQKPEKRWRNGKSYRENKRLKNAINKYGWGNIKHVIVSTDLSKKEAEDLEIYLITIKYETNKKENGYNIESGGCHNGKTSVETKIKQSTSHKGKHISPQTEFKKGHVVIITKEIRDKISKANKGKHASIQTEFKKGHKGLNNKKIICLETGRIYNTIKEAEKRTGVMACHICQVCKKQRKTAGKLHWKYIKE